jgi:DNA-binding XRE family transcriptional regulator
LGEATSIRIHEQLPEGIGDRLRQARVAKGIGLREFARAVGVSASLVSQIERGRAVPSVGTLYAMVMQLGLSLDELFFDSAPEPEVAGTAAAGSFSGSVVGDGVVMPKALRPSLTLANGVRWERLTAYHDREVDFLCVTYDVGAESCPADALMRHSGREYGLVLEGRLGATVAFRDYELGPEDAIAFDSSLPHRFWTIGDKAARVLWTVVGRYGDPRFPDRGPA